VLDRQTKPLVYGDMIAAASILQSARAYVAHSTDLKPGTQAFDEAVVELVERAFCETQPMFHPIFRNNWALRHEIWTRTLFMFRSARDAQLQTAIRAIHHYRQSDKSAKDTLRLSNDVGGVLASAAAVVGWKKLARYLISTLAVTALGAIGLRDDEDEEKEAAEIAKDIAKDTSIDALTTTIDTMLPGAAPLAQAVNMVLKETGQPHFMLRPYDNPLTSMGALPFKAIVEGGRTVTTHLEGEADKRNKHFANMLWDMAEFAALYHGIAYSGPRGEFIVPVKKEMKEDKNKSRYRTVK